MIRGMKRIKSFSNQSSYFARVSNSRICFFLLTSICHRNQRSFFFLQSFYSSFFFRCCHFIMFFFHLISGNLLVIIVVVMSRRLRSITNFFLANLAVADLCVGVFCVIQTLTFYLIDR